MRAGVRSSVRKVERMQYVKSGRLGAKQGGTAGYSPVPAKDVFAWTGFFITPDPAEKQESTL